MTDQFYTNVREAKKRELEKVTDLLVWRDRHDLRNIPDLIEYLEFTLEEFSRAFEGDLEADTAEEAEWFALLGTLLSLELTDGAEGPESVKRHETELLLSKHRDYGPKNIANSPGGPLNGLRVRIHDKIARLKHLTDSGAGPEHESLVDTALDIANYGTIAGLVVRGEWPS